MRFCQFAPAVALVLGAALACSEPLGTRESRNFTASLAGNELVLHNGTSETVQYVPTDAANLEELLALICVGPDCISLASGADTTLLLSEMGFAADVSDLYVHWWHAVPDGDGGFEPDEVRTIHVVR